MQNATPGAVLGISSPVYPRRAVLLLVALCACGADPGEPVAQATLLAQVASFANQSIEVTAFTATGHCADVAWRVVESADNRLVLEADGYQIKPREPGEVIDDCAFSIKLAGQPARAYEAEVLRPLVGVSGGGRFGGTALASQWAAPGGATASLESVSSCGGEQELRIQSRNQGTLEAGEQPTFMVGEMRVVLTALTCGADGTIQRPPPAQVEVPADSV